MTQRVYLTINPDGEQDAVVSIKDLIDLSKSLTEHIAAGNYPEGLSEAEAVAGAQAVEGVVSLYASEALMVTLTAIMGELEQNG